eukprot:8505398-Pyramimonas_sp.AAC.1
MRAMFSDEHPPPMQRGPRGPPEGPPGLRSAANHDGLQALRSPPEFPAERPVVFRQRHGDRLGSGSLGVGGYPGVSQ